MDQRLKWNPSMHLLPISRLSWPYWLIRRSLRAHMKRSIRGWLTLVGKLLFSLNDCIWSLTYIKCFEMHLTAILYQDVVISGWRSIRQNSMILGDGGIVNNCHLCVGSINLGWGFQFTKDIHANPVISVQIDYNGNPDHDALSQYGWELDLHVSPFLYHLILFLW